jgi:hypothetical protein
LYSSKRTSLLFDLSLAEADAFVSALRTVAVHARGSGTTAPIAQDSATEIRTIPDQGISPMLPRRLWRKGRHGEVWMDFYVDSTGRTELSTVRTVLSDDPDFELAVRAYLVRARYSPATVRGHPVRGRTYQRFGYEITP